MLHRRPGHLGATKGQFPNLNAAVDVEGHRPVGAANNNQPIAVNHGRAADIVEVKRLPRRRGQAGHGVGPQHTAGVSRQRENLTARIGSIDHTASNGRRGRPENGGQALTTFVLPELLTRSEVVGSDRVIDGCGKDPAIVDRGSTVQGRRQPTLPDNITVGGLEADQTARSRPGEQDVVTIGQTAAENALALRSRHERLSPANAAVAEAHSGNLQLAVHGKDHTIDHNRGGGNAVGPAVSPPDRSPPPRLRAISQRQVVNGMSGNSTRLFPATEVLGGRQGDGHVGAWHRGVFVTKQVDAGSRQPRLFFVEGAQDFAPHEQGGQCQQC
ncbi:MAG: Uncharacterised protein [Rhodospirillaceae bacterium]|nr:MAG: Uncharacterised protein [Rhodospirillaceae bacterium]